MKAPAMAKRLEQWPLADLIPYDRNPRTHSSEQIDQLVQSILKFGFVSPILVSTDKGILAGHGRLAAAKRMGLDVVPVVVLDHLSEDEQRAYIIADNRLAENAGWDMELLTQELAALAEAGFDATVTGFTDEQIEQMLAEEPPDPEATGKEDDTPEPQEKAVARDGEKWILGPHLVVCGDARDYNAMDVLLRGISADLLWTDPPYNVAYQSAAGDTIANDDMASGEFRSFLTDCLKNARGHMAAGACFYIAHSDLERHNVQLAVIDAGLEPKQCLIWVKSAPTLSRQDYNWRHEALLYGWKPGRKHYFNEDFRQTTVIDPDKDFATMEHEQLVALLREIRDTWNNSVIYAPKPSRSELHPTMKPVGLIRRMITASTRPGETVLDPFAGSGSTLIACELLGRRGVMVELVPHYVDVIIRRWQEYSNKTAILKGDGRSFDEVAEERSQCGDEGA